MNKQPDHELIQRSTTTQTPVENEGAEPLANSLISKKKGHFGGLSAKLLLLTISFVMLSEVFVFLPSVAKFRNDWLTDRLTRAQTVLLVYQGESGGGDNIKTPEEISRMEAALRSFDVVTFAQRQDGRRQLVAMLEHNANEMGGQFDVNETGAFQSIRDAVDTLLTSQSRSILVRGSPPGSNKLFEVIALEAPLRAAMLTYTRNVMILSLIISLLTAAMVYLALSILFVRPIRNIANNMVAFSQNPEAKDNVINPTNRSDELGVAENVLSSMQKELQGTLSSQKRLANLGLAVSKVNHDLRNILASVQLVSDRLTMLPDPEVQRFAPKLIAGIDRAIGYCQSTLVYGSAREEDPKRQLVNLHNLVQELASLLEVDDHKTIKWENKVPDTLEFDADPEQIFRVLMNLSRNAVKELEAVDNGAVVKRLWIKAHKENGSTQILVEDTGPGIPERAKAHLFEAFKGSFSKGGTGLGLAIAHEIVTAHGGTIRLLEKESPGASFEIIIPDR
ncbi:MAG: HAMP domain-containing sensor histidine kinase [Hyphomicrobiales bacterium]